MAGRLEIRIVASKEQARAGTVPFQYIAGPSPGVAAAKGGGRHRKIWLIVAVVVGAGAAGSAMALVRPTPAPAATESAATLSIGPPSVTVGKP